RICRHPYRGTRHERPYTVRKPRRDSVRGWHRPREDTGGLVGRRNGSGRIERLPAGRKDRRGPAAARLLSGRLTRRHGLGRQPALEGGGTWAHRLHRVHIERGDGVEVAEPVAHTVVDERKRNASVRKRWVAARAADDGRISLDHENAAVGQFHAAAGGNLDDVAGERHLVARGKGAGTVCGDRGHLLRSAVPVVDL